MSLREPCEIRVRESKRTPPRSSNAFSERQLKKESAKHKEKTQRKFLTIFIKSGMDIMEERQFQRVQRMGGKCKGGIYQS